MWDLEGIGMMSESLEAIVLDDVWKKFDMDILNFSEHEQVDYSSLDIGLEQFYNEDSSNYPEILRHDCMWTGLCIDDDHNKFYPSKNYRISPLRIRPADKSLFESRPSSNLTDHQQQEQIPLKNQHSEGLHDLENDCGLLRSEAPQTSSELDSESEREEPQFKHDQINIFEGLVEYKRVYESEINRQDLTIIKNKTDLLNTKIEVYERDQDVSRYQTLSNSEEEIDVISFEKPASSSTFSSLEAHHILPSTSKAVLDDKPAKRPRGRPPNSSRKRPAHQPSQSEEQHLAKRTAVQKCYQKNNSNGSKNISSSISIPTNAQQPALPETETSEPDSDNRRYIHNDLERRRRIDLNNAYDELRCLIPSTERKTKSSKSAILHRGAEYCIKINEIEKNLIENNLELKKLQDRFRRKLSFLRKCLAKHRHN